jgi:hypothetical protein
MARTTISLPDSLVERLEPLKTRINVSEICRTALEARVANYQRIHEYEGNEMEQLIERLRIQKQQAEQYCYTLGAEKGREWAIKEGNFDDLVFYTSNTYERDNGMLKLPGDWDTEHSWDDLTQHVEGMGKFYDRDAFKKGFLDAIADVWDAVKDKI